MNYGQVFRRGGLMLLFIAAGVLLLFALLQMVRAISGSSALGPEVGLPFLAIVGVLVMVLALGLMSVAFSFVNMDRTQALGLPDGSVRAVVALSLVVLFAILSINLYSSLAGNNVDTVSGLTQEQKDLLIAKVPQDIVAVTTDANAKPQTYTVFRRAPRNPASEDFAKQLLVIISTLVTAVASFYFGANTVASAQAAVASAIAGKPTVRAIDPPALTLPVAKAPLAISGENLNMVNSVTVSLGGVQVAAQDVVSSASAVRCSVTLANSNASVGDWAVVVSDGNTEAKLPVPLHVAAPSGSQPGPGSPPFGRTSPLSPPS